MQIIEDILKWFSEGFIKKIYVIIQQIVNLFFIFTILLNFSNVIGRYAFHKPIFWAEEIMIFTIVWCVLLGASLVSKESEHLCVGILLVFLGKRIKNYLKILIFIIVISISLIIVFHGFKILAFIAKNDQVSVVSEIPMTIPYAAIPIGFFLIALASIEGLMKTVKNKDSLSKKDTGTSGESKVTEVSL